MTRRMGAAPGLRGRLGTLGIACLLLTGTGCAAQWDELFSRERDWSYITGIGKPHPLVTIRDKPTDADRRRQALSELREPLKNGGNAHDQDTYLAILEKSATSDPIPLCRMTAIRSLGNFRDPRAARILENVYQQQKPLFDNPEYNSTIRKEALVALEKMHDPDSKHLLIRVARQPGPQVDANLADRQQTQDEKIVAIRALGKYRDQECVNALYYIMKSEKDIALRDCAVASLEEVTGKRYPSQREAWLNGNPQPVPNNESIIQRIGAWLP